MDHWEGKALLLFRKQIWSDFVGIVAGTFGVVACRRYVAVADAGVVFLVDPVSDHFMNFNDSDRIAFVDVFSYVIAHI